MHPPIVVLISDLQGPGRKKPRVHSRFPAPRISNSTSSPNNHHYSQALADRGTSPNLPLPSVAKKSNRVRTAGRPLGDISRAFHYWLRYTAALEHLPISNIVPLYLGPDRPDLDRGVCSRLAPEQRQTTGTLAWASLGSLGCWEAVPCPRGIPP